MSQEARFLQAREARSATLAQRPRRSRQVDLNDFWTSVRNELQSWQDRLDALLLQEHRPRTAGQRTEALQQLDVLLAELQNLRRQCLSSTTDNVPELPLADVRLLHKEFTALATRLDQARDEILPPTKFVFKRYRAAMQQQEQVVSNQENVVTTKPTPSRLALGGNVLQNHCDATLVLESNGSVRVQMDSGGEETVVRRDESDTSSSLLLQNMDRCQVTINGTFKALHIQNMSQCVVRVANAIDGAIHVTACHRLKLYAACHQLRMHESKALALHVQVGSGPILEECTDIVFYASAGKEDLVYDAKDFNWLRNGVPSPNFRVVQADERHKSEQARETECHSEPPTPTLRAESGSEKAPQHSAIPEATDVQSGNDDDDDDEL